MEHMAELGHLYFGGDMEAAIPLSGQVVGRIDEVLTAQQIIDTTMSEFSRVMRDLGRQYGDR